MTESRPRQVAELSYRTYVFAFVAALLFLYLRTFQLPATPLASIGDQNLFFLRALRILHGQTLYRDFFELVPPGTDLLYAAIFRLCGFHAWIMAAWGIVVGLAFFCVITRIAGRILRGPMVLLPATLFLALVFNNTLDLTHHWYSTLAALAAVSLLMDEAISIRRILAASSLCGIAALFTQTQGCLTFAALIFYLLWLKRFEVRNSNLPAQLAALVLPFTLIVSCVTGYYIYKGGAHTVFFDLIVFPPKYLSSGNVNSPRTYLRQLPPVHALADILRVIPFLLVYVLVPYVYLVGFYQLRRRRREMPASLRRYLVLLHLVGCALFLAVASGPRYFRLCTVAVPALLVCAWLIHAPTATQRVLRNFLWCASAGFALLTVYHQAQWHAALNLPVGRVAFRDVLEFEEFQWLAQHTQPSDLFFGHPTLAFYLLQQSPSSSEFVTPDDFSRPEVVAGIVQSLQNQPPRYIVLFPENPNPLDTHDHSRPYRQYVHDNYRLARIFYLDRHARYEELWEHAPKSND